MNPLDVRTHRRKFELAVACGMACLIYVVLIHFVLSHLLPARPCWHSYFRSCC